MLIGFSFYHEQYPKCFPSPSNRISVGFMTRKNGPSPLKQFALIKVKIYQPQLQTNPDSSGYI